MQCTTTHQPAPAHQRTGVVGVEECHPLPPEATPWGGAPPPSLTPRPHPGQARSGRISDSSEVLHCTLSVGVGEMNHFTHDRHSTHRESRMALHCRTDLPAGRPARYLPSQVTCWPKVRNFLTSVLAIVPCILAPPHPQSPTFVPPNPAPPLSPPYLLASPCSLLRRNLPSSLLESLLWRTAGILLRSGCEL